MKNGEGLNASASDSWEGVSELEMHDPEAEKRKKIAEIDKAVELFESGQYGFDEDVFISDPEYIGKLRGEAATVVEASPEILPEDQKSKFIDYIPSLNGHAYGQVLSLEDVYSVAEGINRVLGGESLEDYRKHEFSKNPERSQRGTGEYYAAQSTYEAVVGYFGPAEQALNRRNRLLEAEDELKGSWGVVSEVFSRKDFPADAWKATRKLYDALHEELTKATVVAAVLFVPQEQRSGLKEYAIEDANADEFEAIAEGIFRHSHGESLEDIQASLFPVKESADTETVRQSNADNTVAYDKLLGFLGLKEEAAEEPKNPPEWIQRFLRNE